MEVAVAIMTKLNDLSPVSTGHCIYRVPEKLRRVNAEAYTPEVVSIGPLHHGKIELQSTEEIKLRYLMGFLRYLNADLLACTRMIKESEHRIRQCYQEKLTQGSDELVGMIVVDAVFVVELFIRNHYPEYRDEKDEIFSKQWMSNAVFHDLLLLENQVPFFVLANLYDLTKLRTSATFFKLSYEYFKDLRRHELAKTRVQVNHLVDYVRALQLPPYPQVVKSKQAEGSKLTRTAKELQEAGIRFRPGEAISVLEDFFKDKDGTLTMQKIIVHEWTEVYIRNMIAYEQCHHEAKYISSYALLMDSLINTPEDINVLIGCGILENRLGSTDNVACVFNSMLKETMRDYSEFLYSRQCKGLNEYSRTRWHRCKAAWFRWRVILMRDYFSKPWSMVSVIAAVMLLILAFVKAACTFLDTYAGDARILFRRRKW